MPLLAEGTVSHSSAGSRKEGDLVLGVEARVGRLGALAAAAAGSLVGERLAAVLLRVELAGDEDDMVEQIKTN
jgi:hypothetical protein